MAKITGVESITVSSDLLPELTVDVQPGDRLTVVVDYGHRYRTSIVMDDLLRPLKQALGSLLPATATLEGWLYLTTSLYYTGNAAWLAAVGGTAERLVIRNVHLDYEQGPPALWVLGSADLHGLSVALRGAEGALMRGQAQAVLDETPGLPEWIAPDADAGSEDLVRLRGVAYVGKELSGQRQLGLTVFDSSLMLDLERLYHTLAGVCDKEALTWRDVLAGWERLFGEAVLSVHIRTGSYSLALVPSETAYEAAMPPYAVLMDSLYPEKIPLYEPQVVSLYS